MEGNKSYPIVTLKVFHRSSTTVSYPKIRGRKVRFALVGCGHSATDHFAALEKHAERCELVDVCDVSSEPLRAAVQRTKVTGHSSLASLLERTTADCVVLTTPSTLRPSQAIQVAQSGRHVLTEWPMASRWKDGLTMVRTCDNANVHLFIVKQPLRNPKLRLLKRAAEQVRFGRLYLVAVNVFWTRSQEFHNNAKWRGIWESNDGALMNQASYFLDLMEWLVGPVESVMAFTTTLAPHIEAEETCVAALRWCGGALGTLNVTMLTYPQAYESSITILGEKGTVRIGGAGMNEIQHWKFADEWTEGSQIARPNDEAAGVYGFGRPLCYNDVISALLGEANTTADSRKGLRSLELLSALCLSARNGCRIALPLEY